MSTPASRYRGNRGPPDVISNAICTYHRVGLRFPDVEDLRAERGVTGSYESVRRWYLKQMQRFTSNQGA